MNPRFLLNFRDAKYSLDGEAGVLREVLSRLPETNKWVVEFGACDGLQFSNSAHLISEEGYAAVLIEPDEAQFSMLTKNMSGYPNVICLKDFVGIEGDALLDAVLARTKVPCNPDLMIIDVDNNDYHIFKAIEKYAPKVLMIEINSTLLPSEEKIAEYNAPFIFGKHGSSILSMTRLAESKGYRLICNISCNAIYVKEKYYGFYFSAPYSSADFTFEGIYGRRFWKELSLSQKLRKLHEALRREWIVHRQSKGVLAFAGYISRYLINTAARFLRA